MEKMMMKAGVMEVVAWGWCMLAIIMFEAQLCKCELTSSSASAVRPQATAVGDIQSASSAVENSLKTETIRFSSNRVTTESYSRFMLRLLNVLTANANISGSIPILPQLSQTDSRSYVHVEISNDRSEAITFAIEITNVYVVGYQNNNADTVAYLLKPDKESDVQSDVERAAFPNAVRRERLNFKGNYGSLGDRSTVPLGFYELSNAISSLYYYKPRSGSDDTLLRRAFLVVIQMISEAARFKNLRNNIVDTIPSGGSYTPDGLMQEYENKWGRISCQVQKANPNGNFQAPITLTYDSQELVLRTVSQVITIVSVLLRDCSSHERLGEDGVVFSTTPFIRPSVNSTVVGYNA